MSHPNHSFPLSIVGLLLALAVAGPSQAQVPAFPGAMGFGQNATGGRAGSVYRVTTLADSGPGSFRDAVSSPNRIVVFDVGGYVTLNSGVSVRENITIAGQTAPGGGIGFKGDEISFGSRNNIICRHLRVRPGTETDSDNDVGISLYRARNVILDHVSIEFAPWNNVGAVSDDWQSWPVTDVTFQHCLNANPTYDAGAPPPQGFGAHVESVNSRFAWFYTLFANSHNRNPMSKINDLFINNVLYNCSAGYTTHTSTEFDHDIINNYFIAGPASGGNLPWYQVDNNQSIYYSGNYYDSDKNGVLGGGITTPYWYQGPPYGTVLTSPWSSLTATSVVYSARAAYRVTISQAGAWPRDALDNLVISQLKTLGSGVVGTGAGTAGPDGGLYSSQTQTGLPNNGYGVINGGLPPQDTDGDGMPDYFEQANGYNLGANDAMTIGGDGYARIEKYINWLADPHASTTTNVPVVVDLWQYTSGFTNDSPVYAVTAPVNGSVTLSNGHYAVFTPTVAFIGMGSYQFMVNSADGSGYTNTIAIAISALQPPSNLIWRGDGVANTWDVGTTANWDNGTALAPFASGDNVTFDDTGSNTPAISLAASISAGMVSVLAEQDYTFNGSGFAGGTKLFKVGAGKLTLNNANIFSGGVMIQEGVVQLGDGVSLNGSISGNATNHDTLILANATSATSAASLSGPGAVIKRGAGNHTLSGTQTYTGPTTVEAGTLTFAGPPPPGTITNNGAVSFNPSAAWNYTGTLRGSGALNISAGSQVVTLGSANHHAGGTTNTSGQLVLLNDLSAGTGPVTFLSSGSVRPGTGTVITNAFHFNSTTDYMMDTTNGDATWAGPIIPLSGAASFRPGGTAGKLTLTGTAALGNRNFIIPKGSVDLGGNANFSATGTATAFGRNSTANSAFVTIRDNAIVSLGRLNLGGDENTGGRVTVTIRDNGYLSTGLENFDLHLSDRTATYTLVSLDGGTLAVGGFIKTRTGAAQLTTNYFNGGLLLATKANSALLPALSGLTCYVQTGGAKIYDSGFGIGIAAPLLHDPALGAVLDGGLVKSGSGTLTLTGTNTYTGGTIVSNGMLILSSNGSISNTAFIRVDAGATLHANNTIGTTLPVPKGFLIGNGAILGHVRIMNTATISPGFNGIGRLSCNHGVTLDPGATSVFELAKASATNDVLKVYPTANLGGTITVTNLSGPLSAGDSFKLIDAPSYSGSFATVNLPALPPGLAWTNQLATSGNIAVISTAPANPPVFGAVSASGSNLVMSGSNGTPNASFYTLAATNVALPAANWSRVATNQFDANGYFNLTNPIDPAIPQLFYRLQLP